MCGKVGGGVAGVKIGKGYGMMQELKLTLLCDSVPACLAIMSAQCTAVLI